MENKIVMQNQINVQFFVNTKHIIVSVINRKQIWTKLYEQCKINKNAGCPLLFLYKFQNIACIRI